MSKTARQAEFGDFQTPVALAEASCRLLKRLHIQPVSVLEPTCGVGNLLHAACTAFPSIRDGVGVDISSTYLLQARHGLKEASSALRLQFIEANFFATDWRQVTSGLPDPLLVIGNPPWVTNAHLSLLKGQNSPKKTNFQQLKGLDALTGKSNFDISEWMLLQLLPLLAEREATLAMLCKTAVARKLLLHIWKNNLPIENAFLAPINAMQHFSAAVDACFLVCQFKPGAASAHCKIVFDLLPDGDQTRDEDYIQFDDNDGLIASRRLYEKRKALVGRSSLRWRSGIKHDAAAVMELTRKDGRYINGNGTTADVEDEFIFPLLKSSDIANGRGAPSNRYILVTQKAPNQDTACIREQAPKTWLYLLQNAERLRNRQSSIYKNRCDFSIFGVGPYTFAPWKVAISGLYKRLRFTLVGANDSKPVMLDDTTYFLPCQSQDEASYFCDLLNSDVASEFFESFIFWDSKRPITSELLHRIDLLKLAREHGSEARMARLLNTSTN